MADAGGLGASRRPSRHCPAWLAVAIGLAVAVAAAAIAAGVDRPRAGGGPSPVVVSGLVPTPIGVGPRYRLSAGPASRGRRAGMRCTSGARASFDVHIELFANGRAALLPEGIGVLPARPGRPACSYPLRTLVPTGVVEVDAGRPHMLGDLFAVWEQRLAGSRLLSFRGRVHVFVNGSAWAGPPGSVALRPHDEIVVEVGGYVPPHRTYLFPRGA
jgi:hypothetical protein